MALIDRVQARVETDLDATELGLMITEIQAEIESRYGTLGAEITVQRPGGTRTIDLAQPIDETAAITVTEYYRDFIGDETPVVLAANDYRIWFGGRTVERLYTGANPRWMWSDSMVNSGSEFGGRYGRVVFQYTPVSNQAQRDEVTIKVVQLEVDYRLSREKIGDAQLEYKDYAAEREKLFQSLAPRRGMLLR